MKFISTTRSHCELIDWLEKTNGEEKEMGTFRSFFLVDSPVLQSNIEKIMVHSRV